ncbi:hypothetical protein C8R46DRAFT_1218169 [Mycena filopes]|nr:hypothetical protein C8R46DRAFT_1218169 [Mycena filopes]
MAGADWPLREHHMNQLQLYDDEYDEGPAHPSLSLISPSDPPPDYNWKENGRGSAWRDVVRRSRLFLYKRSRTCVSALGRRGRDIATSTLLLCSPIWPTLSACDRHRGLLMQKERARRQRKSAHTLEECLDLRRTRENRPSHRNYLRLGPCDPNLA